MKVILESIEEINTFIENWNGASTPQADEITVEKEDKGMFRKYGKTDKLPTFKNVTPNGRIKLKNGYAKHYDIFTVLQLKELIPLTDEYPSWESLRKAVGTDADKMTVKRICYVIELGGAENIIHIWNSMSPRYDRLGQVI
jgi:hypothetical protein